MTEKTFAGYGLPSPLLQALARMNFTTPTPIQEQAIPLAMEGHDILGSASTGTGKTGAFGIPVIAQLMMNPAAVALIMTPTRELAAQVMSMLEQMVPAHNIKSALLIGGESMQKQLRQLQNKPRLIIGTPGRINDHLQRKSLSLQYATFLVLDETDRMLDMGFGVQIDTIIAKMPRKRQTLMFSATLPAPIVKLSAKYLSIPQRIAVDPVSTPVDRIKQETIRTTDNEKYGLLLDQLQSREGSVIVFVKTKYGADRLASKLNKAEHKAEAIHGDLRQSRRDKVIQMFRSKAYRILVATDVAARGLDIPHIEHVINYDLPQCPEDYIHRIGRTARAGAEGAAVNLLTNADGSKWRAIMRLISPGQKVEGMDDMPDTQKRRGPNRNRNGSAKRFDRAARGGNDNRSDNQRFAEQRIGERQGERQGERANERAGQHPGQRSNKKPHRKGQSFNKGPRQDTQRQEGSRDGQRQDGRRDNQRNGKPAGRKERYDPLSKGAILGEVA